MTDQPIVVVMDRNPDFAEELAVYIGGKRVAAKVMTYHSEEPLGPILGAYVRVYLSEYGTPEDWELELPDVWPDNVWQAVANSEETYLPEVTL